MKRSNTLELLKPHLFSPIMQKTTAPEAMSSKTIETAAAPNTVVTPVVPFARDRSVQVITKNGTVETFPVGTAPHPDAETGTIELPGPTVADVPQATSTQTAPVREPQCDAKVVGVDGPRAIGGCVPLNEMTFEVVCPHCSEKLEFKRRHVQVLFKSSLLSTWGIIQPDRVLRIVCPRCNELVPVDKVLPDWVRKILTSNRPRL